MASANTGSQVSSLSSAAVVVDFDPNVYRLSAIKKAAYKFGDRFHIQLSVVGNGWVRVELKSKSPAGDLAFFAGELCNEVLDQELREVVAQETLPIRNLLMAQAFSATSLVDPLGDDGDYHSDPLNIQQSQVWSPKSENGVPETS